MKKIVLFISSAVVLNTALAQTPTILGTYLPVVNTEIKQVWVHPGVNNGPSPNTLSVPTYGANQVWDYSGMPVAIETGNNLNTHTLKTVPTNTSPGNTYGANYPEATHASHWTSPISGFDTVWTYSKVDTSGMYTVGVVNLSTGYPVDIDYQNTDYSPGMELVIPSHVDMNMVKHDTVLRVTHLPFTPANVFPNVPPSSDPLTIHQYSYKVLEAKGYGTLTTPLGTFQDVLLGRDTDHEITYYINNTSDTIFGATYDRTYHKHFFLRNNTFATSLLMELNTDATNTVVQYAWYTLPSQVGSIEGNVYDTIGSTNGVNNAEVYLFREHSNFTRDDVLATVTTDANGTYMFDDIPYGMYRIAARMMNSQNGYDANHTYMTYFEDTTSVQNNPALGVDWRQCDLITTTGSTTIGKDIYIRHDTLVASQAGAIPSLLTGTLTGINLNKQGGDDPIPGVDIIIKEDPSLVPIISTQTDANGEFSFANLPDGNYKIWVDMPGVAVTSSYNFNVNKGVYNRCEFDFSSNLDSIDRTGQNAVACLTFVKENELDNISIYPNPFENSTVIKVDNTEGKRLTIELFDITGKLIKTIVSQNSVAGFKNYEIQGITKTGVYFVKIQMGEKVVTKKVIKL